MYNVVYLMMAITFPRTVYGSIWHRGATVSRGSVYIAQVYVQCSIYLDNGYMYIIHIMHTGGNSHKHQPPKQNYNNIIIVNRHLQNQ